ncbi:4-hydroxy-tetrahydrodipicolinate synthase [Pontibacter sp. BT310]|uniref:4-hydroxy-tetrahydrodipicolinate synthase n=1 Tax=Pontibacter populi TaxID=890055 RepID=A0ABS6XA64_9BACT|nr:MULTISPECIES: 4-hydroxy-tetrahydrodipicolinate synthase [Pontibacter]MBJ6118034.1 4-hydroxy-tetrahydrodipicolinate synthase [Pontibacter sp. BT310]MBR0570461.1 4-hydroxy-tetrahydrodipicolinate synthase [Microvirga sp. STS03]MBW3364887.1 4-hydroxy-tetrahydrodipicolinate synthase [Pontibacter populi]
MIQERLKGTGVALVTPFTKDLAVDYNGLKKLLDFVLDGGVDYLVINGTTAESVTTTAEEKKQILQTIKEHVNGRVPLVYGLGGNNTQELLNSFATTDLNGIDAILSVSPYYNKPSQQGIYQHYVAIADASPVPVILYNVPGRTGSNMTAETTLKLASHPNIVAIKEASGNLEQCMAIAKHKPADFLLISGDDVLTLPMISIGAVGVISVLANAFPEKFSTMIRHGLNYDFAKASELLYDFVDINPLMYEEGNPVGVKALLERFGVCEPAVRMPLVEASAGLRDRLYKLI